MTSYDNTPTVDTTAPATGKVELKTWAASAGAFIASGAVLTLLETVDISGLPVWAQAVAGSAVTSAVAFLAAYRTAHKPGRLSLSGLKAARKSGLI